MKTGLIIFAVLFALVYVWFYLLGRQEFPNEYKRPLTRAVIPAFVVALVISALILGALALGG